MHPNWVVVNRMPGRVRLAVIQLLSDTGGKVAQADPSYLRWLANRTPDQIHQMRCEELEKVARIPAVGVSNPGVAVSMKPGRLLGGY